MRVLQILVLFLSFTVFGHAQIDCGWGIKLFIRDQSGHIIKDAMPEIIGPDVPHYFQTQEYHSWGEPMGTGRRGNYLLKVGAEGFEEFETKVNFPYCDEYIFELKLQPEGATKTADFVRLSNLSGFIENQNNERIKGIRVILTDRKGKRFESYAKNGLFNFEIYSGEYSIELLGLKNSESVQAGKINLQQQSARLNVKIKNDNQQSEIRTNLLCEQFSNEDESTWCNLTVSLSK